MQNKVTLAPNSIKLARFCKHFATIVSVLLAIGEGVSKGEDNSSSQSLSKAGILYKQGDTLHDFSTFL